MAKKCGQEDNYLILRILGETGIRISELSFFKVDAIDKTMSIRNKGKEREISVKLDLLRLLRKYCRDHKIKSGPIIFNPDTKKYYAHSTIYRRLKKLAGMARVNKEHVHPHAFRHYFANVTWKLILVILLDLLTYLDIVPLKQLEFILN